MTIDFISLTVIVAIAAFAPIITRLVPKQAIPEIVILLFAGAFWDPIWQGVFRLMMPSNSFLIWGLRFFFCLQVLRLALLI